MTDAEKKDKSLVVFLDEQRERTERVMKRLESKAKEYQDKLDGLSAKMAELSEAISGFEKARKELETKVAAPAEKK